MPGKALTITRWLVTISCVIGLVVVYTNQRVNLAAMMGFQTDSHFYVNRTIRFLVNDLLTIGIIWALFYKRAYVIFAIWVQLFGLVFLLLPYFVFKHYFPGYDGPLISFLHRLVLNPILLLLLIPAFFYQDRLPVRSEM